MDMKDVIISIRGLQSMDGQNDEVELVTAGQYGYEGGEGVLSYMESELTGLDGTKTTFTVGRELVTLTREGVVNSRMIFQEGRKHLFLYELPYGSTTMGVDTQKIKKGLGEHGGNIEIDYSIDIDNVLMGKNKFRIDVREA